MTLTPRDRLIQLLDMNRGCVLKDYSVKQLSELAKISIRALHYYDEIGLLKPSYKGANNYRYYNENDALKLQQIMFFKEMGFSLEKIKDIINAKDFDLKAALINHQIHVEKQIERQEMLLAIIKQTLKEIDGKNQMKNELYQWHSEERQKEYEEYLIEKYGDCMKENIAHSKKAFAKLSDEDKQDIMKRIENIESALIDAFKSGVEIGSKQLVPILDRHREWIAYMWAQPCPKPAYSNLADMYMHTPDFVTRYETLATGFCDYLVSAMKEYAAQD